MPATVTSGTAMDIDQQILTATIASIISGRFHFFRRNDEPGVAVGGIPMPFCVFSAVLLEAFADADVKVNRETAGTAMDRIREFASGIGIPSRYDDLWGFDPIVACRSAVQDMVMAVRIEGKTETVAMLLQVENDYAELLEG